MHSIKDNIAIYQEGNQINKSILFIHGFPYDHKMWDKQVGEFKSSYYCVTYDVRGLGNSPAGDGQFTMESFVDDVESIIDELALDRPVLCGLSMGGYIALRAVERMENKFGGLILCDTKSEPDNNEGKLKRAAGIKKINELGVKDFVEEFVPNCFSGNSVNNLKEYNETLGRSLNSDPAGVKGCLLAMIGRTDTTQYLSKIKLPSLVICGEEDKLTPPEHMENLASSIRDSQFVLVPDAAHMTPIENPAFVNRVIKKFLEKISKN